MLPDSVKLSTVKLFAYALFHLFVAVPKLYVLLTSGVKLDATSALIVNESVSWLPIVILPSVLMLPVAWILPFTLVSP